MSLWWGHIAPVIGTFCGIAMAVMAVVVLVGIAHEWWQDRHRAPAYVIRLDSYRRR